VSDDHGSGGHQVTFLCVQCDAEDTFRGVVPGLAADSARKAGWVFDQSLIHRRPDDREALCPKEAPE
jgi:hypothetical protein